MRRQKLAVLFPLLCITAPLALAAPPDDSTPKAAAKSLYAALAAGDQAAAKQLVIVPSGYDDAFKTLVDYGAGFTHLADAMDAKFGKDAAKDMPSPGHRAQFIADAAEQDNGDTALLIPSDQKDTLHLKYVDGHWKIDIFADPAFNGAEAMTKGLRVIADAANATAADTAAGKFKSVEEVQNSLNQRLQKALNVPPPTTAPAAK